MTVLWECQLNPTKLQQKICYRIKKSYINIAIYTLTPTLHDPQAVDTLTKEFLTSLNVPYILKGDDFSDYGSHDLNPIFVRTGGTEGIFQQMMPTLVGKSDAPFAHCTIPFDMVQRYELDTHFESGIGVGIRGFVPEGPVTICKVSGDLSRAFVAEGELVHCQTKPDLCRTQLVVRLAKPSNTEYFLTNPIGNHHVIVVGQHAEALKALLRRINIF